MPDITKILNQYFGYTEFRPLQKEIISDLLSQKDVFVLMPTGGGKSLCYQVPALTSPKLTVVVSPLIALMKDQVDQLTQLGVKAAFLNSTLSQAEKNQITDQLKKHEITLLYVAPERLMQDSFLSFLQTLDINFFAIDEAHCISEWGHDFRPEYRQLRQLKLLFPNTPIIALTATATERVQDDIIKQLNIQKSNTYKASFNRTNLTYHIQLKQGVLAQTLEFIKKHSGESGIIYCQSRDSVENLAASLQAHDIKTLPYHAGLDDQTRKTNQDKFIKEDIDIIVATIAFGMGINKSNVRFILHTDLPSNIESYYQQTGRAGRDGLPSECLLLWSLGDREKIKFFINQKTDLEDQRIANWQLRQMLQFVQSNQCRRVELLKYFGETFPNQNCAACDNCISPKETFDATEITQKILSCVYRAQQRFGTQHIARILTGKLSPQIERNNHDKLSTFGIISDYSIKDLQAFMNELIQLGFLEQTEGEYPTIHLTEKSFEILKNKTPIFLTKIQTVASFKKAPKTTAQVENPQLFERLRLLRKQLADEQNVPPFVIFSDATLREITNTSPKTKAEFGRVKGVGIFKLKKYADIFLEEIKNYNTSYAKL